MNEPLNDATLQDMNTRLGAAMDEARAENTNPPPKSITLSGGAVVTRHGHGALMQKADRNLFIAPTPYAGLAVVTGRIGFADAAAVEGFVLNLKEALSFMKDHDPAAFKPIRVMKLALGDGAGKFVMDNMGRTAYAGAMMAILGGVQHDSLQGMYVACYPDVKLVTFKEDCERPGYYPDAATGIGQRRLRVTRHDGVYYG